MFIKFNIVLWPKKHTNLYLDLLFQVKSAIENHFNVSFKRQCYLAVPSTLLSINNRCVHILKDI